MYALAKPHGSCRGSSGSDMHKTNQNQNRDIKHRVFDCPALEEVRVQHAGLFAGSADLRSFLAQESSQVAAFVSAGFDAVLGD